MKKSRCQLCNKRTEETCDHPLWFARYGYYLPNGMFYLTESKGMRIQAEKYGIDPEPFIEKTP